MKIQPFEILKSMRLKWKGHSSHGSTSRALGLDCRGETLVNVAGSPSHWKSLGYIFFYIVWRKLLPALTFMMLKWGTAWVSHLRITRYCSCLPESACIRGTKMRKRRGQCYLLLPENPVLYNILVWQWHSRTHSCIQTFILKVPWLHIFWYLQRGRH